MTTVTEPVATTIPTFSALSPNKFQVVIQLFPDVSFWAQRVTLPSITLGQNTMPTNKYIRWSTPGDTIEYDDLIVTIMIDEGMTGYRKLKKWQEEMTQIEIPKKRFSDLSILVLTNNSTPNLEFQFKDTYPVSMSGLILDAAQDENTPFTCDIAFKHSHFAIIPTVNNFSISNGSVGEDPSDFS